MKIVIYSSFIIFSLLSCTQNTNKQVQREQTSTLEDSSSLACCQQNMPSRFEVPNSSRPIVKRNKPSKEGMVWIPAGEFMMGGDDQWSKEDEFPKHKVKLSGFYMDKTPVTNQQFKQFIDATNYITTAEQVPDWEFIKTQLPEGTPKPHDSLLQPSSLVFSPPNQPVQLNNHLVWWSWVQGANWKHPKGPDSNIDELSNHPVVHVTHNDALAYAKWSGKRLPTEAEFEYASRGGLVDNIYPWGNELINKGAVKANSWQGEFPITNLYTDGFYHTSPVGIYPANNYGLYDMAGNVWEWCADWYHYDYYKTLGELTENPKGPESSYDPNDVMVQKRVTRGGSYLCNDSYCSGFRVAARMKSDSYSSQAHVGFRCVSN